MKNLLGRRRSLVALTCMAIGLATACVGPKYGGKPVRVVLTTKEQERAGKEAVPASISPGSLAANAYLATFDEWLDLGGHERMAEIERLALEAEEPARAEAVKKLLLDLARFKCPTPTPADVQAFPRKYVFVASKGSQVRSIEFQPHQLDPNNRKAIVSFEPVE